MEELFKPQESLFRELGRPFLGGLETSRPLLRELEQPLPNLEPERPLAWATEPPETVLGPAPTRPVARLPAPTPSKVANDDYDEEQDAELQKAILQSLEEEEVRRAVAAAEAAEAEEIVAAAEAKAEKAAQEAIEAQQQAIQAEEFGTLSLPSPIRQRSPSPSPTSSATTALQRTFAPAQWLTDQSIAYVYALLASQAEVDSTQDVGQDSKAATRILMMDPATAFWLGMENGAQHLDEARKGLKLEQRELVMCPINDSTVGDVADMGTHWSLLICYRYSQYSEFRCVCYDSLSTKLMRFEGTSLSLLRAEQLASNLLGKPTKVELGDCAGQLNGFDCGIYVLLFSQLILNVAKAATLPGPELWERHLLGVRRSDASDFRSSLYERLASPDLARSSS